MMNLKIVNSTTSDIYLSDYPLLTPVTFRRAKVAGQQYSANFDLGSPFQLFSIAVYYFDVCLTFPIQFVL